MLKTYPNPVLTKAQAEQALDTAASLVRRNLPLYTDHCQNHSSVHDIYPQCENNQWTCGFWPGEIWLSYERTGDEAFKKAALTLVDSFMYRIEHKIEVDHHDMGFLYSPSCVAAYKLTGSEIGRKAAILAADHGAARLTCCFHARTWSPAPGCGRCRSGPRSCTAPWQSPGRL